MTNKVTKRIQGVERLVESFLNTLKTDDTMVEATAREVGDFQLETAWNKTLLPGHYKVGQIGSKQIRD